MTDTHTFKEEVMVVCPKIAETIAAARPCEIEQVKKRAAAAISRPS